MATNRQLTDVLVVGTGVAGLFFALKLAKHYNVLVLTKAQPEESNTRYAQGGIAGVVSDQDSFDKHITDTLTAGDGLCREDIVRMVVEEGPARIQELMAHGANFDRDEHGELHLGREGGHSANRILHSRDSTGREIARALLEAVRNHPRITLRDDFFAVDLLTQHHLGQYINRGYPDIHCYGVYALDLKTRQVWTILSKITVLASGGAGNVYETTTNPAVATGDGIAMVLRAKGRLANMEFYQFHPTALYEPGVRPAFLLTEALRGMGAELRNPSTGERFMPRYDSRAELAPRDIVARAIDNELKQYGLNSLHLDCSVIPAETLEREFPSILAYCRKRGLDPVKAPLPVAPAAHYLCGGVDVTPQGETSIRNLFAVGECSHTGLHGANRLASNSLLEAIVFAQRAAEHSQAQLPGLTFQLAVPDWNARDTHNPDELVLIMHNTAEVQRIMSGYVGIVRSDLRLNRAERRLQLIYQETEAFYQRTKLSRELCELRNLIACAYLIIKCARIRRESRGLHYNLDYPNKADQVWDTLL